MPLDLKVAIRQLARAPGTTLAAVLTLAVGIGATSAVFTFVAAVMSLAEPVRDMDRRVAIWSHNRGETEMKNAVSPGDFVEWQRRATLLDALVAIEQRSANLGGLEPAVRAQVSHVTPNYFEFFEWRPVMGRGLVPDDAVAGAPRVAVLSEQFWRTSMASRRNVVGRTIRLDGEPTTIVGVLPRIPAVEGIYVPMAVEQAASDHASRRLFVWARLRPGATVDQARAEMTAIGEALERDFPKTNSGWSVNTRPLQEEFVGPEARLAFAILVGSVLSVLLIGCVNIANLFLARGVARQGELAVRVALGAGGWRIARQLFVESCLVAAGGAAASIVVSRATLDLFVSTFPLDSPWLEGGALNPRALLFTGAAAIFATLMSGLAPAMAARRTDLVTGLHASGRSGARRTRRLTGLLVTAEIALAVLLLIVSGLLMRVLINIERLDPGFDVRNVLTASVTLPERTSPFDAARWFDGALERVRAIPGVSDAGATSRLPFAGSRFNANRGLEIEGRALSGSGDSLSAVEYTVTPGFVETLRLRVLAGRAFSAGDGEHAPLVAMVSQVMARRVWPDRSPLGARLRRGDEPAGQWRTVVGVVADIRNDDADQPPIPYLYVPLAQAPARSLSLALRTPGDAAALAAPLRRAIAEHDPDQALYDVRTMEDVLDSDLQGSRVIIRVLGAFALFALGLAGLGVWGVAAQSVGQRTREIGVRVALGANSAQVIGLVAVQGFLPIVVGLTIGLAAGLGVARVMRGLLFQVSPADPQTVALTLVALALVGMTALVGPALRAARLDPLAALRAE